MNKCFLSFLVFLLGFLAKGQGNAICSSQHEKNQAAAEALIAQHSHLNPDNYNVFKCKTPEPKARKVRSRLRAITLYEIQPVNNSAQSWVAIHNIPEHLFATNKATVLPFYYVFLFRLTPF